MLTEREWRLQARSRTTNFKSAAPGGASASLRNLVPERPRPRQFSADGVGLGMHSDPMEQEVAHALAQVRNVDHTPPCCFREWDRSVLASVRVLGLDCAG